MSWNERPIGVFDSGVGGLTVLEKLRHALPCEHFIFIGDNAHSPYGEKTKEQLLDYAKNICQYFQSRQVKMIVLACNTTSANVLEELRILFKDIPIIGVIDATIKYLPASKLHRVLLLATQATVTSKKYDTFIHQAYPSLQLISHAPHSFVPLIESGQYRLVIIEDIKKELKGYISQVDGVILGCTHYPIIQDQIQQVMGDLIYISSSDSILWDIQAYLKEKKWLAFKGKGRIEIYTTGKASAFYRASSGFFHCLEEDIHELRI